MELYFMFFVNQKTAYEMRISDGSSDVCSSDLRVTNAGERVRGGTATEEDLAVIDTWRAAHRNVINSFQGMLRNRTRGIEIIVAQRHKRKRTIRSEERRVGKGWFRKCRSRG